MTDWQALDQTYIMPTVKRYPIAIAHAEGNYLIDTEGNRYLDLFTGLAVNILGHSHPRIMQALNEQGHKFLHISNLFLNPPAIRLAERLIQHTFGRGKIYFCNSGAEATEAAIKLIHKWAARERNGKDGIVVVKNSFHGRTLGALRLTRQPSVYQDFPQPAFPVYEVEINNANELREICRAYHPAAVLVEPILGSGGVVSLSKEFLQAIADTCAEENMLFCIDEIQTGIGRTGTLFAYQHFALQPDVILFAKGVGGGLPLGGIIVGEKAADVFQPGDHGTTFAPSPLSAALGNAVLDVLLNEGQLEKGRQTADELWNQLYRLQEKYPGVISHIDGKGMMLGIRTTRSAEEIADLRHGFLKQGILVNVTAKTVIRLLPPLTLTSEEIQFFIQTLETYIREKFV
ncbi:aspartate aminotransferase family protein [Paenactinomyces guangxiensis]|uniref:Acetylornithine transaminase n=1 Tax=Paenactinomyces guangxiensis TaxID=1490290 RepID=A0A7W2A7Y6_9BACL|nr:acetylornithine transaminase [Paenactinomyces guangxiensis]MBA4493609.1 acetylornithine transaminase [Paenactinomyces guangxiensis]MBH8590896.1 acetylornithine transaminase [Paenactinomyces guangxiensis]